MWKLKRSLNSFVSQADLSWHGLGGLEICVPCVLHPPVMESSHYYLIRQTNDVSQKAIRSRQTPMCRLFSLKGSLIKKGPILILTHQTEHYDHIYYNENIVWTKTALNIIGQRTFGASLMSGISLEMSVNCLQKVDKNEWIQNFSARLCVGK